MSVSVMIYGAEQTSDEYLAALKLKDIIAAKTSAFTGVQRFGQDGFTELNGSGNVAAVHTDLKRMPPIQLRKEFCNSGIVNRQYVGFGTLPGRLVQQKDYCVNPSRKIVVF